MAVQSIIDKEKNISSNPNLAGNVQGINQLAQISDFQQTNQSNRSGSGNFGPVSFNASEYGIPTANQNQTIEGTNDRSQNKDVQEQNQPIQTKQTNKLAQVQRDTTNREVVNQTGGDFLRSNIIQQPQQQQQQKDINQANRLMQYNNLNTDQFANMIRANTIPTDIKQELGGNNAYIQALEKVNRENRVNIDNKIISGEGEIVESFEKAKTRDVINDLDLSDKLPDDVFKKVQTLKNDDGLTNLSKEIKNFDIEINDLQNQLKNMKRTVEGEFATSLSKSALNHIVYDRSIALNEQLQSALGVREAKIQDYQRIKQEKEEQLKQDLMNQQQTMQFLNSNNGMALYGTSIQDIMGMEKQGMLPSGYTNLYSNYMEGLVFNTLSSMGSLTMQDAEVIQAGIQGGLTPKQILSGFKQTGRFQEADNNIGKVHNGYQYNPSTGLYDIRIGGEQQVLTQPQIQAGFSMYQNYNTYEGNIGIDFTAPKGTRLPATVSGTIKEVKDTKGAEGIVVVFLGDDGKTYRIGHNDPSALELLQAGNKIERGGVRGIVGNTGHVKTIDPKTNEWVEVRDKSGNLIRPDLEHRGNHASIIIKDTDGKRLSIEEQHRLIQTQIKGQVYQQDNFLMDQLFRQYEETLKIPDKRTIEGLGMNDSLFIEKYKDWEVKNRSNLPMTDQEKNSSLFRSLPLKEKETVRGLLSYSVPMPPRNARFTALMGAVQQIDPNWSEQNYRLRYEAQKKWNNSLFAGGVNSKTSTTMSLIQQVDDVYKNLNGQTRIQSLNGIVNTFAREFGDTDIVSFDVARDLMVKELASAFKGNASPSERDVETMNKLLSGKLTPNQTQSALDMVANGLFLRIASEGRQYANVMGNKPNDIFGLDTFDWMLNKGIPVNEVFDYPDGREGGTTTQTSMTFEERLQK